MSHRFPLRLVLSLFIMLLTACGGAGGSNTASSSQPVQVKVTETDFHITSSVTTFMADTSYHFVVTNKGQTAHEFMIMPTDMGNMSGMSMGDMDKVALAKVENITPGQTKTLDYTFPASAAGSHPQFACYYPGHYEAGMKLDVMVKA